MDFSHIHDTISVYSCILTSYVSNVDEVCAVNTPGHVVFVSNKEYSVSLKVCISPFD